MYASKLQESFSALQKEEKKKKSVPRILVSFEIREFCFSWMITYNEKEEIRIQFVKQFTCFLC